MFNPGATNGCTSLGEAASLSCAPVRVRLLPTSACWAGSGLSVGVLQLGHVWPGLQNPWHSHQVGGGGCSASPKNELLFFWGDSKWRS